MNNETDNRYQVHKLYYHWLLIEHIRYLNQLLCYSPIRNQMISQTIRISKIKRIIIIIIVIKIIYLR